MKHIKTTCFFTETVKLRGNLSIEGSVRLEGELSGNLLANGTIYSGKNSVIDANLHARRIHAQGKINGHLRGEQNVTLESKSEVNGEIITGELAIHEDVVFNGHCRILPSTKNTKLQINLNTARAAIAHRDD